MKQMTMKHAMAWGAFAGAALGALRNPYSALDFSAGYAIGCALGGAALAAGVHWLLRPK